MENNIVIGNFTTLYQELRPVVFRYLFYLSSNSHLAEELTLETFYQAYLAKKASKDIAKYYYIKNYGNHRE